MNHADVSLPDQLDNRVLASSIIGTGPRVRAREGILSRVEVDVPVGDISLLPG